MKAVILSGSPGTAIFPLANYYPKLLLPLHVYNLICKDRIHISQSAAKVAAYLLNNEGYGLCLELHRY